MTKKNGWDLRYAQLNYVYGTEPNAFIKKQLAILKPGKILFPAEGEGRNAVYAAGLGWEVYAFDSSKVGKQKAEALAEKRGVKIHYQMASFEQSEFDRDFFDCVALVFAHALDRQKNHRKMIDFLKTGGTLLLEGFSKKQIHNQSGGPPRVDMLFSKEELENDFSMLSELETWEEVVDMEEGNHHMGQADVIRVIGKK
jgi:SAM-dependent methyltransferase